MSKVISQFNLTSDNPFWNLLKETNQLHITARQRHGELLDLCKTKGVAFKDIENHLLNEAKKCGLYRSNYYDAKTKKMMYPPKASLVRVNWYVSLRNFLTWVRNNYVDYGMEVEEWKKKSSKPPVRSQAVIRTTQPDGTTSERQVEVSGATISQVLAGQAVEANPPTPQSGASSQSAPSITSPVSSSNMSLVQVQQIILSNFAVLGKICEEKGADAVDAFNDLMLALGQEEEFI